MSESRLKRAVERNLEEIVRVLLYQRAIEGLQAANTLHSIDFIRLSHWALFDQMMAHAIKVFDRNSQSSTFWYIYRCKKPVIDEFCMAQTISLSACEAVAAKLKIIRDGTHFHLDSKGILGPNEVWKRADLSGGELLSAAEVVFSILDHVHFEMLGRKFFLPKYDGQDATRIANHAYAEGLLSNI